MEGGETEVPGAVVGPCAGAVREVWPRSELPGFAGHCHGRPGRQPVGRPLAESGHPGAPGRTPNSGLLLTGRGTKGHTGSRWALASPTSARSRSAKELGSPA